MNEVDEYYYSIILQHLTNLTGELPCNCVVMSSSLESSLLLKWKVRFAYAFMVRPFFEFSFVGMLCASDFPFLTNIPGLQECNQCSCF